MGEETSGGGLPARLYSDTLSPAAREIGGTLAGAVRLALSPANLLVRTLQEAVDYAEASIEQRFAKWSTAPEKVIPPPPEIVAPVLQALRFANQDETLREMYLNLLARSMEESRVRASEMPEEKPRFNFDFAGFVREVGIKGIGTVLGLVLAVYGTYWIMNNMMGGGVKLPPLGYVSGTLTIGGKPAVGVKVYLSPLDRQIEGANEKKERARDSAGVTDLEGRFTMYYLPNIEGAKVGPCRLWLEAPDPTVAIPASYGIASDHKVDVKAGNNEPQKIEL